ncbi:MAG: AAA family ATPase [Anaerolineaceae bacterium]|nr:AAA family ATPase [Anaerolineaceae bacterium]
MTLKSSQKPFSIDRTYNMLYVIFLSSIVSVIYSLAKIWILPFLPFDPDPSIRLLKAATIIVISIKVWPIVENRKYSKTASLLLVLALILSCFGLQTTQLRSSVLAFGEITLYVIFLTTNLICVSALIAMHLRILQKPFLWFTLNKLSVESPEVADAGAKLRRHMSQKATFYFWVTIFVTAVFARELALPAAIILACKKRWSDGSGQSIYSKRLYKVGLLIVFLIAFAVLPFLLDLPNFYRVSWPNPPAIFDQWRSYTPFLTSNLLSFVIIIFLAENIGFLPRLPRLLKTTIIGFVTGNLLITAFAFPTYLVVYVQYLPELAKQLFAQDHSYLPLIYTSFVVGITTIVATGPVTVLIIRPSRWISKFTYGACSLSIGGALLFGTIGAWVSGIVAHAPLYGAALDRTDYQNSEWVLKLAETIDQAVWFPLLFFLLLLVVSVMTGGLLGLITPVRLSSKKAHSNRQLEDYLAFILPFTILASILILLIFSILTLLGPQVLNVFVRFGVRPTFDPLLISSLNTSLLWIALIIVDSFGLYKLYKEQVCSLFPRRAAFAAIVIGLINLSLPFWVYAIDPFRRTWVFICAVISILVGLTYIRYGVSSWIKSPDNPFEYEPLRKFSFWTMLGSESGILAAILVSPSIASFTSLIFIAAFSIAELSDSTAIPPGLAWLQEATFPLFNFQVQFFEIVLLLGIFLGALLVSVWFILSHYASQRWLNWILNDVQAALNVYRKTGDRISKWTVGALILSCTLFLWILIDLILESDSVDLYSGFEFSIYLLGLIAIIILHREHTLFHFKRLSWPIISIAYCALSIGLLGFVLTESTLIETLSSTASGVLFSSLCLISFPIVYLAIHVYNFHREKNRHFLAIILIPFILGSAFYFGRNSTRTSGGISRLDFEGQELEPEMLADNLLNTQANNRFYYDSLGQLWFGGGNTVTVEWRKSDWQPIQVRDVPSLPNGFTDEILAEQLSQPFLFEEDSDGFLWIAQNEEVYRLEAEGNIAHIPGRLIVPNGTNTDNNSITTASISNETPSCVIDIMNLWDTNGNLLNTFVFPSNIGQTVSFSPNNSQMTIKDEGDFFRAARLQVRSLENRVLTLLNNADDAKFSPNGDRILTIRHSDGSTALWSIDGTQLVRLEGPNGESIADAEFNSEGTKILGTTHRNVYMWDINGTLVASLPSEYGRVFDVAFYANNSKLVTLHSDRIVISDAYDLKRVAEIVFRRTLIDWQTYSIDVSENGKYFFVAYEDRGNKDVFAYDNEGVLRGRFEDLGEIQLTSTGDLALFINTSRTMVRLWDGTNANIIIQNGRELLRSARISPDGSKLVTAWTDGQTQLWDSNGNLIDKLVQTTLPDDDSEALLNGPRPIIAFSSDSNRMIIGEPQHLLQLFNREGELLSTLNSDLYLFENINFTPDSEVIGATGCITENAYQHFAPGASISALKSSSNGLMWIATHGMGVYAIDSIRNVGNSNWVSFQSQNSALPADYVNILLVDENELVWAGTENGLSFFDGTIWNKLEDLPDVPITALLQDSVGRIWIGTHQGGYLWDGDSLHSLPHSNDENVGNEKITQFFEDSQSGIWVATELGVYHYHEQEWEKIGFEVTNISSFVEAPLGVVWFGGEQGLIRNDLRVQPNLHTLINTANSALATDWVRDIHASVNDELWVSTFAASTSNPSPWISMCIVTLLMGYLFIGTYRGYQRHPETIARRIWRELHDQPQKLHQRIYQLFAQRDNAFDILLQLANYFDVDGDKEISRKISTIAKLPMASEPVAALEQSIDSHRSNSDAIVDRVIHEWHQLLMSAVKAANVMEIVALELTVNPGENHGTVTISWRQGQNAIRLPEFVPHGTEEAWQTLERLSTTLRKSRDVDAAADSLSYLAEAMTLAEKAQAASRKVGQPEGPIMEELANRWRTAVTEEINRISGCAELRIELRTRQLRRSEQVTIVFQLHNVGRAAAENVTITLLLDESEVGSSKLTRLASGRTETIEFAIYPPTTEKCRIICQAVWEDRTSDLQAVELGDVISFYETAEEFVSIPNPYIVGHPVKASEMFHGREDVFKFISQNLRDVTDRTLVLHGQRRTGKTSILYQLLNGRLGANFLPILIDMQELAPIIMNTADFLGEIAYQLARTLQKSGFDIEEPGVEAFANSAVRTFNRFLDRIEDNLDERRLVIMFDEFELIESKINEGKLTADLLGYFRSLMQHRQGLVFIFTGTHRLEEMSHDYWSILFNIALYRRVSFLNREDAFQLIRRPVANKLVIDELAADKIFHLTRGQAYFTQLICWALVNRCNQLRQNYATINDVNDAIEEIVRTGESHFAYVWQQANRYERLTLAALAHTIQPGKLWARPAEVAETLQIGGENRLDREQLVSILEQLTQQEILESASEGSLRYRFQLEILKMWLVSTHSMAALIEKESAS